LDPRLKQRLVGAAVLLALAVIFLPMLLDGTGQQSGLSLRDGIPAEPEFSRPETPAPLEPDASASTPQLTRPPQRSEVRPVPEPVPEPPASAATSPVPAPSAPAAPSPAPVPQAPPVASSPAGPGPGSWVVQVGSFSEQANAESERDRLRAAGFEVFVEPARAGDRRIFRVKIGPVSSRDAAEGLRERLGRDLDLQGIVVSQP